MVIGIIGENIVYVISEPEQIRFLPDGTVKMLVSTVLTGIPQRCANI